MEGSRTGTPGTAQARQEDASERPGDLGNVGVWPAHLAHVELRIRVREAGELPGTAVEVDVAGPEGGQEAQMVVHWGTQAGLQGPAQGSVPVLSPASCRPEPSPGPQFSAHVRDTASRTHKEQ